MLFHVFLFLLSMLFIRGGASWDGRGRVVRRGLAVGGAGAGGRGGVVAMGHWACSMLVTGVGWTRQVWDASAGSMLWPVSARALGQACGAKRVP